jgi:hypothetical protein
MDLNGRLIATEGCLVSDGSKLISVGQSRAWHESDGDGETEEAEGIQTASATPAPASGERDSQGLYAEYFVLLDHETGKPLPDFAWATRCEENEQVDITGADGSTREIGADERKPAELTGCIQLKPIIR